MHCLRAEALGVLLEILHRRFEIVDLSDIGPIALVLVGRNELAVLEQTLDQLGEVHLALVVDVVEDFRLERVDARAHLVGVPGLLLDGLNATDAVRTGAELHHSVVDLDLLRVGGHRGDPTAFPMRPQEVLVDRVCEDVTVHEQEGLLQASNRRERSDRAEGPLLTGIRDPYAMRASVAEEGLDQARQVAGGHDDLL